MEACATAHHWARTARSHGHDPYLLHAQYVRPYVRRNKTDAADADALLRARRDPDLKPVPSSRLDQQALQGLHRIRQQWVATRTPTHQSRAGSVGGVRYLAPSRCRRHRATAARGRRWRAPVLVSALTPILDEISTNSSSTSNSSTDNSPRSPKHSPDIQRLMTIPGVGVIIATAMVGSVADIHRFQRARQFAAWLGLTPREYSSGQTRHLGRISKHGDGYLRMLLTHGARSALLLAHRQANKGDHTLTSLQRWVLDVEQRTHHNKATIALANKMARIIWVTWTHAENYSAR